MPQDLGRTTPKSSISGLPAAQGGPIRREAYPWEAEWAAAARATRAQQGVAGALAPPLPRPLQSNNCTGQVAFPASAGRTAYALSLNVAEAVGRWGIEKTGFLTLTFADHVLDPKEAQRRLHSLTTHVLRPRYGGAIRVYERQKSGRIHYHLLVNVGVDIRTGFDFAAVKVQDYRSASPALRSEWAFWRTTSRKFGFGRTELLPVISNSEAVSRYVGKYISKHLGAREDRDVGVRLVSYVGPRVASVKFAWAEGRGRSWREGLGALVRDLAASGQIDAASVEAMRRRYGKSWAWDWRDVIAHRAMEGQIDQQTGEIR
jgi:hypothetical protein